MHTWNTLSSRWRPILLTTSLRKNTRTPATATYSYRTEAADEYLTDLKTYTLDSYIKIITGEEDIDFFDEYVEEFNSTGGQQIIDEINEMMNAGK